MDRMKNRAINAILVLEPTNPKTTGQRKAKNLNTPKEKKRPRQKTVIAKKTKKSLQC